MKLKTRILAFFLIICTMVTLVPAMALAAKAFGATGYFFEVHPDPEHALSDGPNMLHIDDLESVIKSLL